MIDRVFFEVSLLHKREGIRSRPIFMALHLGHAGARGDCPPRLLRSLLLDVQSAVEPRDNLRGLLEELDL